MRAPNIRFNLTFFDEKGNAVAIRTLDDLRANLNVSDFYAYLSDGTLSRWLRCLGQPEAAARTETATKEKSVRRRLSVALNAIGVELSVEDLTAIVRTLEYQGSKVAGERDRNVSRGDVGAANGNTTSLNPASRNGKNSGRRYEDILAIIELSFKQQVNGLPSKDPTPDIGELVEWHYDRFIKKNGYLRVPGVIPYLLLNWPKLPLEIRFQHGVEQYRFGVYDVEKKVVGMGYRCGFLYKDEGCDGKCVKACSYRALGIGLGDDVQFYPEYCIHCGKCIEACPHKLISKYEWYILVNGKQVDLPYNCGEGNTLPQGCRWLVEGSVYLKCPQ